MLANTTVAEASQELVIQALVPLRTHESPSSRAVVEAAPASLPLPARNTDLGPISQDTGIELRSLAAKHEGPAPWPLKLGPWTKPSKTHPQGHRDQNRRTQAMRNLQAKTSSHHVDILLVHPPGTGSCGPSQQATPEACSSGSRLRTTGPKPAFPLRAYGFCLSP